MTTPLRTLLAQAPHLNDESKPFNYTVDGNSIVGTWDIVSARFLELDEAGRVDNKYSITVTFDEKRSTYNFTERKTESLASASSTPGKLSFGTSKSTFVGKSSSKEFGSSSGDGSAGYNYSFETKLIKEPLFAYLKSNGWERKRGFLGGLFGS